MSDIADIAEAPQINKYTVIQVNQRITTYKNEQWLTIYA